MVLQRNMPWRWRRTSIIPRQRWTLPSISASLVIASLSQSASKAPPIPGLNGLIGPGQGLPIGKQFSPQGIGQINAPTRLPLPVRPGFPQ